jgi:hypothetical protein
MAAIERLLPRHWDGRRLMRFLAGLALLAASFLAPAPAMAAAPAPASSVVSTTVEAPASAIDQAPAVVDAPVAAPVEAKPAAVTVEAGTFADSECQRAFGSRAPPRS